MTDSIHINSLELRACIGVPDEERATPQRLTATLTLEPTRDFRVLEDQIERTIDYAQVCLTLQRIAAERPRRLLETLAQEMADTLLREFPALRSLTLELRKFILPDTAYVAVQIRRPSSAV